MKVLFAVSNENISESIVKKYQSQYKEIISYRNVYYFNAILKEIQKDKSYDRIVISEDLEPFANNNYDQIDKFLFDKLDSISDEATNNSRSDTPIIFICTDRRAKGENFLVKLFSIGVYNAVIGQDRSIDKICQLLRTPRTKKEAKLYYQIESEDATYQPENENDVSEVEIQNILNHYKRLGKDENAYVKSFDNIASQYNDVQLKLIASFLPLNVKAVLEEKSPKYQKIMAFSGKTGLASGKVARKPQAGSGLKINFLKTDSEKPSLRGPIIVPSAVDTKNVKKFNQKIQKEEKEIEQERVQVEEPEQVQEPEVAVAPKKRRGRPRKNPLPEVVQETVEAEVVAPKRGRGRPPKVKKVEEPEPVVEDTQDYVTLPGLDEEEEEPIVREDTFSSNSNDYVTLPGLDDEEEEEETPISNSSLNYNDGYDRNQTMKEDEELFSNSYSQIPNRQNYQEREMVAQDNQNYQSSSIENLLTREKKLVAFIGTSKNGTSFLVNNIAQVTSSMGINTAILDTTQNRNAYYIYTQNEEALRKTAESSIPMLRQGRAQGIKVNKNLSVYTSIPDEEVGIEHYEEILSTLVQNHSLVLIDCDFATNFGYFAQSQEIYLVQSMDVLTIQPLTAFLRELKTKNLLPEEKLRVVINKELKVHSLTNKAIIGGMSYYNDPAMSFMTELFNRDTIKYCTIPFEEQTYAKYLEGLVNCEISLNGYSKIFMQKLRELSNMVYPLIASNQRTYRPVEDYKTTKFSNSMNDTLNRMKRNY